jgi:hypothetical protein
MIQGAPGEAWQFRPESRFFSLTGTPVGAIIFSVVISKPNYTIPNKLFVEA